MSESLDIRNLEIDSDGARFDFYVGFGKFEKIEIKKDSERMGVIASTDFEQILEENGIDDDETWQDLEELMDGLHRVLSSVLNVYKEEKK